LPGDLYEEWAEERRRELHKMYLSLLIELGGLYEEREDLGSAFASRYSTSAWTPGSSIGSVKCIVWL
jgi:hypothetical protein